jgi:DnaJ-class molecular chaperone
MTDHYEILEVERDCDQSDIKKAYRRLAKEYHPDKNKNKGLSESEMKEFKQIYMQIHKAYEVLSDVELRAEYDKSGISAGKGETIIDPLQAMMRMMEEKNETGVPDVIVPVDCTLEELYNGFVRDTEFPRISPCHKCKATGTRNKKKADCDNCKGRGATLERIEGGEVGFSYKEAICNVCRGSGLDPDIKRCKECNGNKYDRETIECEIELPEGAYEGYFIKFDGEGNFIPKENRIDPDVKRTDVLFVIADVDYSPVEVDEEDIVTPSYNRGIVIKELQRADRADLMIKLEVDFAESLCGITRRISHLDGSVLEIEINDAVVNNDIIVMERKGMPVISDEIENREAKGLDTEFGDLLIRFDIKRPELDKSTKRKIWQILTNTSYQKRDDIDSPEIYEFLDTVIAKHLTSHSNKKREDESESGSEYDSDSSASDYY